MNFGKHTRFQKVSSGGPSPKFSFDFLSHELILPIRPINKAGNQFNGIALAGR